MNVAATAVSSAISKVESTVDAATSAVSSIASKIESVANAATSIVLSAISKVESAMKAAATAILNVNAIKALILRNCLLSTKQFCVGFSDCTECKNLLLKVSSIILEALAKIASD